MLAIIGLFVIQLTVVSLSAAESQHRDAAVRDYCQLETFSARCRHGEVVVMTMAKFGRMRVGRCIDAGSRSEALEKMLQSDSNLLGCYADVLDYADRTCSGKTSCDIAVPNRHLLSTRPCFAQLTMYFEAAYQCVSVVKEDRSCVVRVSPGLRQHIRSSPENSDSGRQRVRCGTRSHPWLLEVQTGQQVNISLLDFSGHDGKTQLESRVLVTDHCSVQYGYIVDKTNKNNVSICSTAAQQRHKHLYQSTGNLVEIVLTPKQTATDQTPINFLLAVEAVGCSNLVPPSDAWLRRTDNEATIGCYTTRQRWNLRCDGNRWTGTIGVCADWASQVAEAAAVRDLPNSNKKSALFEVVAIVTICTVGLAICLVIIFVGVGCARRYQIVDSSIESSNKQLIVDGGQSRKTLNNHETIHRSVVDNTVKTLRNTSPSSHH